MLGALARIADEMVQTELTSHCDGALTREQERLRRNRQHVRDGRSTRPPKRTALGR